MKIEVLNNNLAEYGIYWYDIFELRNENDYTKRRFFKPLDIDETGISIEELFVMTHKELFKELA